VGLLSLSGNPEGLPAAGFPCLDQHFPDRGRGSWWPIVDCRAALSPPPPPLSTFVMVKPGDATQPELSAGAIGKKTPLVARWLSLSNCRAEPFNAGDANRGKRPRHRCKACGRTPTISSSWGPTAKYLLLRAGHIRRPVLAPRRPARTPSVRIPPHGRTQTVCFLPNSKKPLWRCPGSRFDLQRCSGCLGTVFACVR